jgi:hypothetical protein
MAEMVVFLSREVITNDDEAPNEFRTSSLGVVCS